MHGEKSSLVLIVMIFRSIACLRCYGCQNTCVFGWIYSVGSPFGKVDRLYLYLLVQKLCVEPLQYQVNHATRVTTMQLKQPICFYSVYLGPQLYQRFHVSLQICSIPTMHSLLWKLRVDIVFTFMTPTLQMATRFTGMPKYGKKITSRLTFILGQKGHLTSGLYSRVNFTRWNFYKIGANHTYRPIATRKQPRSQALAQLPITCST